MDKRRARESEREPTLRGLDPLDQWVDLLIGVFLLREKSMFLGRPRRSAELVPVGLTVVSVVHKSTQNPLL